MVTKSNTAEEVKVCVWCGEVIVQPIHGPKRTLYCSRKCYKNHKQSSEEYKEQKRLYDRQYREANKDAKKARALEYNQSDIGQYKTRIRNIKKFGMTEEEYMKLRDSQSGCCCICQSSLEIACIDHNHMTGKVRGLLCNTCNSAIGLLREDKSILTEAINYLMKHEESSMS